MTRSVKIHIAVLSALFVLLLSAHAAAQGSEKNGLTGWDYLQQKRYAESLALLEKDHTLYPKSHEILDGIGWCHFFLDDLDKAENYFKQALEQSSSYRYSVMGIDAVKTARLGPIVAAEDLLQNGRFGEAVAAFEKLIDRKDSVGEAITQRAWRGKGLSNYYLGRYNQSLKDLTRALRLDKNDAAAHAGIGYIHYARKKYSKAEITFDKALELDPSDFMARISWAWCSYFRGNTKTARKRFTQTASLFPASWGAHRGIGWCHDKNGQEVDAIDAFRKAISMSSTAVDAALMAWIREKASRTPLLLDYGFALIEDGFSSTALTVFRSMPPSNDPDPALLGEALSSLNSGDNLGASRIARSMLDRGSNPHRILKTTVTDASKNNVAKIRMTASAVLGWSLLRLGDLKEAAKAFNMTMDLQGFWPDAKAGLGHVRIAQNRYPEAELLFLSSLELLPGYETATSGLNTITTWRFADYNLAWTRLDVGEIDIAAKVFHSLRSDPSGRFLPQNHYLLDYSLGVIARMRKKPEVAEPLFRSALETNAALGEAAVGLGWSLVERKKYGEALKVLDTACALRPLDPEPCQLFGKTLIELGDTEKAIAELKRWQAVFPTDVVIAELLGREYAKKQQHIFARVAFQTVITYDVDRIPVHELKEWLKNKDYHALYGTLGWACYTAARYSAAEKHFKSALETEPGENLHRLGMALAMSALGRHTDAGKLAEAYLEAIEDKKTQDQQRRSTRMTLGWNAYNHNELKVAMDHFKAVAKLDGTKDTGADVLNALGWTWVGMGRSLRAREYFLKALAKAPRLESSLKGLEAVNSLIDK